MATFNHPITGIPLNSIKEKRKSLDYDEAVTAHILRMEGRKIQTITAMLGTNQGRVVAVLNGEVHPKAANDAVKQIAA